MTKTSSGLRLVLFTLAASTSLSGLAAQTAPGGRPVRTVPAPSATPAPGAEPASQDQARPAANPIRITAPQTAPAAGPAPAAKPASGGAALAGAGKIDPKANIPLNMIVPPTGALFKAIPGTVMLSGRSYEDTIAKLPVARRISPDALRTNPRITVGTTEIDFTPLLKDPLSLPSLAGKMRAMPDLVKLEAETIEAAEITGQGVAVKTIMTYRIRPGACNNPQNRAKLASVMARCFEERTEAQLDAAFADPKDPRYVADPAERAKIVKLAQQRRAQTMAGINQRISEFRVRAKEPQLRKDMTAGAGEAEVTRLAALDDKALARELINQSLVKVEGVMFVPRLDSADLLKNVGLSSGAPKTADSAAAKPAENGDVTVTMPIPPQQFMTGFTLGREYEWQKRIETTIPWCLIGCEETYYAEAYAGFGAGMGLRLPFEVSGTYTFQRTNGVEKASFAPAFKTVNADQAFYNAVNFPANQRFEMQELLAKFGAWAGLRYKLPLIGESVLGIQKEKPLGVDFTSFLPGDLKGGQFTPPMPCPPSAKSCPPTPNFIQKLDNFDMTGGLANLGVAGAKVFPFIKGELFSNELSVQLRDLGGGQPVTISAMSPGNSYNLKINPADKSSAFKLEQPNYNIGMKLIPGVTARLFIDLAVWGTHWDFDVALPQLGIEVPKGGKTFSCHDYTMCDRTLIVSPKGIDQKGGTVKTPWTHLLAWSNDFLPRFGTHCPPNGQPNKDCLNDLTVEKNKKFLEIKGKVDSDPKFGINNVDLFTSSADLTALGLLLHYNLRNSQLTSYLEMRKGDCLDQKCKQSIQTLYDMVNTKNNLKALTWDFTGKMSYSYVESQTRTNFKKAADDYVAASKKAAGK